MIEKERGEGWLVVNKIRLNHVNADRKKFCGEYACRYGREKIGKGENLKMR